MSYFTYLPLPENRITNHLLTTLTFLTDRAVALSLPPEMFRLSSLLDFSQQSLQNRKKALLAFLPPFLVWLDVIIHCRFLFLWQSAYRRNGMAFLACWCDYNWLQQQERPCYIKVISVPLFGQNKIQVYLLCVLRGGLVCCDYQLADCSSFPAPWTLSLVY